jgi:tetratricopeptide (TPR) repeat protein
MNISMRKFSCIFLIFTALASLSLVMTVTGTSITASIGTGPSTPTMVKNLETEGFDAIAARNWTGLHSIAQNGLSLDNEDPVFYTMEGYAYRKLGNYTGALAADTRALEIQPNPVRYANRGTTYLALGNYSAALSDGQASVALDPGYGDAYALEAMAYLGMNRTTDAQEAIDHSFALEPENPSYWHVQGLIALTAGNCTLAIESLQRSIILDPDYSLPWPTMQNATQDLATAQARCNAARGGMNTSRIPLEIAVVLLGVAGAVFFTRRN